MFNLGAVLGGVAEQVADDIDTRKKRVELMVDKAWDTHTKRYWQKRDKEEAKAELVEDTIKEIAALNGVTSLDQAAAIYNKLGTVDNATDWLNGAKQITNFGGNLQEMGYISAMPEDFESSEMTAKEYAASFGDPIKFAEGFGIPSETGPGIMGKKVAAGFASRRQQMEAMGLVPEDVPAQKVTYADIKVDPSLKGSDVSVDATKEMLTTQLARVPEGSPQAEAISNSLENLRNAQREASGGRVGLDALDKARRSVENYYKSAAMDEGVSKTGVTIVDGEIKYSDDALYSRWRKSKEQDIINYYKDSVSPEEMAAIEAHLQVSRAETEAESVVKENAVETNTVAEVTQKSEAQVPETQTDVDTAVLKGFLIQDILDNKTKEEMKSEYMNDPKNVNASEALFEQVYNEAVQQAQVQQNQPSTGYTIGSDGMIQNYTFRGR